LFADDVPEQPAKSLSCDSNLKSIIEVIGKESVCGQDEFNAVVSLNDGKVLYTTPTLSDALGFPKDMWVGRSFIDFIHKKDKVAFANHITSGKALLNGYFLGFPSLKFCLHITLQEENSKTMENHMNSRYCENP